MKTSTLESAEDKTREKIVPALRSFVGWLDRFGEESYDHQSYYAGPIGGRAKRAYYDGGLLSKFAVVPMVFSEAFLPSARRIFWKPMRFPIADAHYAMGFAFLCEALGEDVFHERAVHFLEVLDRTRSPGYSHYCWGYPFVWQTREGSIREQMPLITTTPYAYEAFSGVYDIDSNPDWLEVMHSIAEHAMEDIAESEFSENASTAGYSPTDKVGGVINAGAYRASLLAAASQRFSVDRYWQAAERNVNFVLQTQEPDGSWPYAVDGVRGFVDHYHTCFVMKALAKIERMTGHEGCRRAIERGVEYYVNHLFDDQKCPKPFSRKPRLLVYRAELYDYAECINLGVLLRGRFSELDACLDATVEDLLHRWHRPDGAFRARRLLLGWDNVPMHRWGVSQVFRSLSLLIRDLSKRAGE